VLTVGGGSFPGVSGAGPDPKVTIRQFTAAWAAGDYRGMYRLLTADARRRVSYAGFLASYRSTASTASLLSVRQVGTETATGGAGLVTLQLRTKLFGRMTGGLALPLVQEDGGYRVDWSARLTWPGLNKDEKLKRVPHAPKRRGSILARDRTVLAEGPADGRQYPAGTPFAVLTGFVRTPQTATADRARMKDGWPQHAPYGQGGLEQSLDDVLGGRPRIELVVAGTQGDRPIARHKGRPPHNVTTTLDAALQAATTDILGDRYGGIAVIDTRTGGVRASAGIGMDGRQPPGSTFKVVTAAAALTGGVVTPDSYFDPVRFAMVGGFKLRNFHHELCGGTLIDAFAHSCNSVFAPVAVETGPERFARMSKQFGFNRTPTIAYPLDVSVVPELSVLANDVHLGVAGIGQGGVTATPLQMAAVAQVVANRGIYNAPWLSRLPRRTSDRAHPTRAISPRVASDIANMMRAVVSYGTGTSASSAFATINGKTGTAELGPGIKSDAWFIGYAPAQDPKVAVAVLVVHGGVGGKVAAPLGRQVLEAALGGG
jgi:cell division protein FtsI/penicillin-binding protein 2